ncbi:MAG: hypothetical protein AB2L24_20210 [Mangrovibacterium sp.]
MYSKNNLRRDYVKPIYACLIAIIVAVSCKQGDKQENKVITSLETYREMRQEKLNQHRPVIHNNDGCDAYLYPLKISPEFTNQPRPGGISGLQIDYEFSVSNFLKLRSAGLKGSDVSTISYCSITSSFGQFTHNTKVGEFLTLTHQRPGRRNVVPEFVKLGTDPLKVTNQFARENGFEFFWSNRINDTHDSGHRPDNPYERWSKLKTEHPEYLFGSPGEKLPHGRWSSVDFNHPEIRNLCVQYYTEVCENYDVDGIELDFFRHCYLFKEVARGAVTTTTQLAMLTDMLTQIREMTEKVGMKKGKPILILVRIPDSVEYCREVGIDIETWLEKGLVDMIVGSDYFRLNFWTYLVALGHKHGVKVYAGLSEPRVKDEHPLLNRLQNPVYRARAFAAWQAGVDGLYIFNEYNTRSQYLREIGNTAKLENKNNLYFATYRNGNPESYLKNGKDYSSIPVLTPANPTVLDSNPLSFQMEIGNENTPASTALILYFKDGNPELIKTSLNDTDLKYLKKTNNGLSVFEVPKGCVKPGENTLNIGLKQGSPVTLMDAAIFFYRNADDPDTKKLATACFSN